jgi:transcriptional regulator with XRE-family HTH domain
MDRSITERSVSQPPMRRKRLASRTAGGDLGRALRIIRIRLGFSQRQFGSAISWPQNMLSQYESGDKRPSCERLILLLRLAATDEERGPILAALDACGVLASDLSTELSCSHGRLRTAIDPSHDSNIQPRDGECNV